MIVFDFETHRIAPGGIYPKPVCLAHDLNGKPELAVGDVDMCAAMTAILESEHILVNQSIAFDMRVAVTAWPQLRSLVRRAYREGRVGDTSIRMKLNDLAVSGRIGQRLTPDGSYAKVDYSLADLVRDLFGEDISEGKSGPDSWRLRYGELDGLPLHQWPRDAVEYPLSDVHWARVCWKTMQVPRCGIEHGAHLAEAINVRADFVATGVTQHGLKLDPNRAQLDYDKSCELRNWQNFGTLTEAGILVPPQEGREYAKQPGKFTQPKPEKLARGELRNYVLRAAREHGLKIPLTKKAIALFPDQYGEKRLLNVPASHVCFDENPNWIGTSKGMISSLAEVADPVGEEMTERSVVDKLVTSYFPGLIWDFGNDVKGSLALKYMRDEKTPPPEWDPAKADVRWADTVHPNFSPLMKTGRSSSFAGSLYPSCQGQNVDPRVRSSFVAREGYLLLSIDYAALELYAAAWTWTAALGYSVLYDLLQKGLDPHVFLASSIYPGTRDIIDSQARYAAFAALKQTDEETYSYQRKFAKAVGLGLPGGLGCTTLIAFAWGMFQIRMTIAEAEAAREIWLNTFPEARDYLKDHMYQVLRDPQDCYTNEDGDKVTLYSYTTPRMMERARCSYSEAANGSALQSPSAEGFKLAMWAVQEAIEEEDVLAGVVLVDPIHDELLFEIPICEDYGRTHAAVLRLRALMEGAMCEAMPGLPFKTEAVVMYRWDKFARPAYSPEGWLVPADEYPMVTYDFFLSGEVVRPRIALYAEATDGEDD